MKWTNSLLIICAIATVLVTGFIFDNSAQSSGNSYERSGPISERIHEMVEPESADGYSEDWDDFVRKCAHVIEFGALGICMTGLALTLFLKGRKLHICASFLYILSVAVMDEFVQSFTGRTSSVQDVLLDFVGGVCGIGIILLLYLLLYVITQNSHRHKRLK